MVKFAKILILSVMVNALLLYRGFVVEARYVSLTVDHKVFGLSPAAALMSTQVVKCVPGSALW